MVHKARTRKLRPRHDARPKPYRAALCLGLQMPELVVALLVVLLVVCCKQGYGMGEGKSLELSVSRFAYY